MLDAFAVVHPGAIPARRAAAAPKGISHFHERLSERIASFDFRSARQGCRYVRKANAFLPDHVRRAFANVITLVGLCRSLANSQEVPVPSGSGRIQEGKVDDSVVVEIQPKWAVKSHTQVCGRVDDLRVRRLCQSKHTNSGGTGGEGVGVKSMME